MVAVVVVGAAVGTWFVLHRATTAAGEGATTQLVAATTETVKETVSATGTIEPANQANLKFAQTGKVTAVGVKVGDTVTAGQTLASIDPTSLQAAVTLAEQQLTAAQAQLTAATSAASSSQIASANAQVTSAQSKLTAAQEALGQASLTSSIAGTVAAVNVSVGDSVTAGSSSSGSSTGTTSGSGSGGGGGSGGTGSTGSGSTSASSASSAQVVVIATSSWVVNATVGASDLAKLKNGLQASITPSGATQPIFGTVSTVGVIGTTSGGTSTFPVTIAVTGSPAGVYAGTTAAVVITVKQVPDVLTVPTAAIHEENGQTVVYQMKDGTQVSTPVTVGTVYGTTTQITKGLTAGDEVVVTTRAARLPTGNATGGTGGTGTNRGGFNGNFGGGGGFNPGGGQAPPQAPGGALPGGG
ncbi:MAG TPA: biotin/lipoyl-binding protein [Lapillicoccus sp.]|nr:biotin/lipoyl-binding protein [Lapillicoccus sp.]